MKSTIAVLVAVLGFAATVAWAGDDMPRTPSQQAPSARVVDIDGDARTPGATPAPGTRRAPPAKPAAKQPRAAVPLICACLTLDSHA
jgi:hypothetical protein